MTNNYLYSYANLDENIMQPTEAYFNIITFKQLLKYINAIIRVC